MVEAETAVWAVMGVIGVIGVIITVYTIRAFHLRNWKHATYYFAIALIIFSISEFVYLFRLVQNDAIRGIADSFVLHVSLEVGILIAIIVGVYRLKETAEKVGA